MGRSARLKRSTGNSVSRTFGASSNIHSIFEEWTMTNVSRVKAVGFLVIVVTTLTVISQAQNRPPIAEEIAKTYGLDSFGQVEAIRYTFNVQFPGVNLS